MRVATALCPERSTSSARIPGGPRARRGWRALLGRAANEEGATLVEFAVTFAILLAWVFVLIEACLAYYTHEMISELAREGTRYAMVHGATCVTAGGSSCTANASQVNTYVSGLAWPNIGGGTVTPNTTYPDGNESSPNHVQVQVTYRFPVTLPFVPAGSIPMSSTSKMVILQ